jgi:hypothetical protein
MTRADAEKAVTSAETIANGPWLPFWRYGVPSQSDAVWDVLKPARDYIELQMGKPMERPEDDSPKAPVIEARIRLAAIQADAAVNSVLRAVSRTREHT